MSTPHQHLHATEHPAKTGLLFMPVWQRLALAGVACAALWGMVWWVL